jgi:hypothetical protein
MKVPFLVVSAKNLHRKPELHNKKRSQVTNKAGGMSRFINAFSLARYSTSVVSDVNPRKQRNFALEQHNSIKLYCIPCNTPCSTQDPRRKILAVTEIPEYQYRVVTAVVLVFHVCGSGMVFRHAVVFKLTAAIYAVVKLTAPKNPV